MTVAVLSRLETRQRINLLPRLICYCGVYLEGRTPLIE
jgi:hypothetical protein